MEDTHNALTTLWQHLHTIHTTRLTLIFKLVNYLKANQKNLKSHVVSEVVFIGGSHKNQQHQCVKMMFSPYCCYATTLNIRE